MARILFSSCKPWNRANDEKLRAMYPKYSREDILKAFPSRSWKAICFRARALGVSRSRKYTGPRKPPKNNMMAELRHAREERNLTGKHLANILGMAHTVIMGAERGAYTPRLKTLEKWCAYLGFELTVKPIRQSVRA